MNQHARIEPGSLIMTCGLLHCRSLDHWMPTATGCTIKLCDTTLMQEVVKRQTVRVCLCVSRRYACLTCQIVDALLAFLHSSNVSVQPNFFGSRFAGLKAHQLGQALPVLDILDDTQLDGFAKLLPEGGVLLRSLCCFSIRFCMPQAHSIDKQLRDMLQ